MTKPQVYLIIAALFAMAGCYIIAAVMIVFALFLGAIALLAKLPKPPQR